jgi:hypothetical protein
MSLRGLSVFRDNIVTLMVGTDDHQHKHNGYLFVIYLNATEFPGNAKCPKIKTSCWINIVLRNLKKKKIFLPILFCEILLQL